MSSSQPLRRPVVQPRWLVANRRENLLRAAPSPSSCAESDDEEDEVAEQSGSPLFGTGEQFE